MKNLYSHTSSKFHVDLNFFWLYWLIKDLGSRKFIIQIHPNRKVFYIHSLLVLNCLNYNFNFEIIAIKILHTINVAVHTIVENWAGHNKVYLSSWLFLFDHCWYSFELVNRIWMGKSGIGFLAWCVWFQMRYDRFVAVATFNQ